MSGLGMNIVIDRLNRTSDQYANRLARLRSEALSALVDLEAQVRAAAEHAGVSGADVEEHVRTAVGVVVRRAVADVLEDHRRPPGNRMMPGWPLTVPGQAPTPDGM